ncbi:YdcF-like protein [Rhizobium phaseoli]|uniref:YdcF family protein n=2 Tax=Rhizobium TaxID=379 RepID=A0A192TFS2_9HYPH|nr:MULTISPECIES: YdcF family protein [Rhizobium]ANL29758.1 YdcF-like protein [Rhizobium phaseoli]ANL42325.1 YdcF-like protein [Rhizobium phaseoli]ANL55039.1 YdcF-like protein [Rhizobium phaseoli]ANL61311.1 YdcF-like protein [Rhizobium phaseoli]ANL86676.1 YdcF-like protein [Rhizobium phaseoli]
MTMGHTTRNPIRRDPELDRPAGLPPRRGLIRRLLRWGGFGCVLAIALLFGGFLRFADSVTTLKPPVEPKADAIVVLTGGYQRIDQAVELLQKGVGKRLLISGVHPTTTPAQIRKMTQGSANLFSCCVDIGHDALDTIGNAEETSNWIHAKGYRSVLVVTNNYHMPRSLAELSYVDPDIEFIPYPVVNSDLKTRNWFTDPNAMRVMLAEYAKVLLAGARNITGFGRHTGLRSASASASD